MKRLFILSILLILAIPAYSISFYLCTWNSSRELIETQYEQTGWIIQEKNNNQTTIKPESQVYFHGNVIYSVTFYFDNENKLICQSVAFNDLMGYAGAYSDVLRLATKDKARLLDIEYNSTGEKTDVEITAADKNNKMIVYNIYGIWEENLLQVHVSYINQIIDIESYRY